MEKVTQAEALEPTAESSDRNPELASATESDNKATPFGEALAKIVADAANVDPAIVARVQKILTE